MKKHTWYHWLIGIVGLSTIVIFHEMGHFLACKLFHVGTPLFSIGFGPRLYAFMIRTTTFQLAAFPLGGYVSMNPVDLAAQPYFAKLIIMSAGIIFNFAFALIAFLYLMYGKSSPDTYGELISDDFIVQPRYPSSRLKLLQHASSQLLKQNGSGGIMGPIGIIKLTGKSLAYGSDLFIFTLAMLSINIGIFNLLPIPGLDGSQLLFVTLEKITGSGLVQSGLLNLIFLALLTLFIIYITLKDIRRINKN